MPDKRNDDDAEGVLPSRLEADRPEDRDLLDRLSAKLLRFNREATALAVMLPRKPKPS